MPTPHLIRTAIYLYKTAEPHKLDELASLESFYCGLQGEHAKYELENMMDDLIEKDPAEYIEEEFFPELFKEIEKRKIDLFTILHPKVRIIFND